MISRFISGIILILISPILIFIGLIIYIDDGFPIIFKQTRVGINNSHFKIFKFRTMKKDTPDLATHLVKDVNSHYIKVGKYLRKLSIDELPQLFNILKGDLKFIGPRPALYNQKNLIDMRTKKKISTLHPGVTGWAQVNGRDQLSTKDKVQYDLYYLNNKSLLLDIKIICKSFYKVVLAKDVT